MEQPLLRCLILLASLLAAGAALGMGDPTRPPQGYYAGSGAGSGATDGEGLVLQSVIISDARRSAIISGEYVLIGGKVAGARLVKVSETEVVLLQGASRRTLRLYPGVDKRPPASPAAGKR
jgi:MSHA biogenesis protein MshK